MSTDESTGLDKLKRLQHMPAPRDVAMFAASKRGKGHCVVRFDRGYEVRGESVQEIMYSCGIFLYTEDYVYTDDAGTDWYDVRYF